jgi:hypothetical protein
VVSVTVYRTFKDALDREGHLVRLGGQGEIDLFMPCVPYTEFVADQ